MQSASIPLMLLFIAAADSGKSGPSVGWWIAGSVLAATVFVIGVWIIGMATRHRQETLERIAERFSGHVESGDLLTFPQVRLRLGNFPAVLKYVTVGEDTHTRLKIPWPNEQLRCEIYPQTILSGLRKLIGVEDIEIGSPKFDAAYFIAGNKKALILDLLTPRVQQLIDQLAGVSTASVFANPNIYLNWAGGELTITTPTYLANYDSLAEFVSLTAELLREALEPNSEGIEFVGQSRDRAATPSQCQICGEPLLADLVHCPRCHTPHHRDCWEYFGGCSTYACGQKKYEASGSASRTA